MRSKKRSLLRRHRKGTPAEELAKLHQKVEEAKKYPIREAEQRVGVKGYSSDGDTAGYLSPQEYREVQELPVE